MTRPQMLRMSHRPSAPVTIATQAHIENITAGCRWPNWVRFAEQAYLFIQVLSGRTGLVIRVRAFPKCLSVGGINEFREFPEIKLIANFPNLIADLRICVVNLLPGISRKASRTWRKRWLERLASVLTRN